MDTGGDGASTGQGPLVYPLNESGYGLLPCSTGDFMAHPFSRLVNYYRLKAIP